MSVTLLSGRALAALMAAGLLTVVTPFPCAPAQEKAADAAKAAKKVDRQADKGEGDKEEKAQKEQRVVVAPLAIARPAWSDEQFDNWLFSRPGGAGGAEAARKSLSAQTALVIADVDRVCRLDDAQRKKLQLAGRGDLDRLFAGYERAKEKFRALGHDVERLQEVMPDVSPLQQALGAGAARSNSLVTKCLRSTLTADQYARYQAVTRERAEARHRAHVAQVVAAFEQIAPLQDAKRRELTDLLLRETKPLREPHQYEYYAIMMQVAKIPEEKFKAVLTDMQWKAASRFVGRFRGVEQQWRQAGILPKDDDEDEAK